MVLQLLQIFEFGHRDLGNGYFEEIKSDKPVYSTRTRTETKEEPIYKQVPAYKNKYYYEIERWVHNRYENTSGTEDNPYWPTLNLMPDKEREGSRSEKYSIKTINNKKKEKTYEIKFLDWQKIHCGDSIKVKISAGTILGIPDY